MKKKWLAFIGLGCVLALLGCGQSGVEAGFDAGQTEVSQTEVNQEDALEDEQSENVQESEAVNEDSENAEALEEAYAVEKTPLDALEEYAWSLRRSQLIYNWYDYAQAESGTFVHTDTFKEHGTDPEGYLYYILSDLDQDNEEELLVLGCSQNSDAPVNLVVSIYESDENGVHLADSRVILENAFSEWCDSGNVRFFIKDEKYILMDSAQHGYLSCDGSQYDIRAFSYNGEKLEKAVDYCVNGSDFYGSGKHATELTDELRTLKMEKTIRFVADKDIFRICAADEGLRSLYKLSLENTFVYGKEQKASDITAYFEEYYGQEDEDDYFLKDTSVRLLTEEELSKYNKVQLRKIRNEIYARNGWKFEDERLDFEFSQKAWYVPCGQLDDKELSEIELANKNLIVEMERTAPDFISRDVFVKGSEKLAEAELQQIEEDLNSFELNGFLCSIYRNIRDASLVDIFYNGAGLPAEYDVEKVRRAYMEKEEIDTIETDLGVIDAKAARAFITQKTGGLRICQFRDRLGWDYLEEEGVFAREYSDTNYSRVSVTDGYKSGDVYTIYYENESYQYLYENSPLKVTFTRDENGYHFISNEAEAAAYYR